MNGATEATQAELLATAQAMNVNLIKLQGLLGGARGAGGSGGGVAGLAAAAGPAGLAMKALSGASSVVSGLFSAMGNIIGKVIGGLANTASNLFNFAKAAANGTAKLSDFYDAFKDLPFFVGEVASIFASIVRYSEGLLASYRDMTKAGASFSGDLFVMAQMATRGYLSLQEFSKIVRANSEIFSTLGGNVESGMGKFVDVQNKLMGPGSAYSKSILGLGFTAEETADVLASVMNLQGNLNKKELANNDKVAASVNNVINEMDLYAKLTGKTREDQEKALKKASFDNAWKTFTQGLNPDQAASATLAVDRALQEGGEGASDNLRQMFMTGGAISTPITDAAKAFYVQTQGAGDEYTRALFDSVMNMKAGSKEQAVAQAKARTLIADQYNDYISKFGPMGGLLSVMGNKFVNNANLMGNALKNGGLSADQNAKRVDDASKQQAKQATGTAAALGEAGLNIKNFGIMIMGLVNTIIGPIAGELINVGQEITTALLPVMKSVAAWFKTAVTDLRGAFDTGGFSGLMKKFGEKITEGAGNVWTFIKPIWLEHIQPALESAFKSIMDFLQPYFKSAMDQVSDMLNAWVYTLPGGNKVFNAEDPEQRAKRRQYEQALAEDDAKIKSLKDQIEANRSAMGADRRLDVNPEYKRTISRLQELLEGAEFKRRADAEMARPGKRHSGTIGMTGNWWEKADTTVNIQQGESVVTQSQMDQIVNTASQNGVAQALQQLNSLTAQLLRQAKDTAENTRLTHEATRRLDGNLFA